jgi:predicted DsbA family dithiol-disulfide isomerase
MRIDVWSDLTCPWCGLGKHRLEAALSRLPADEQPEVVYHSFQLNPYAPAKPTSVREMLTARYGLDDAGFARATGRVEALAEAEGLTPYHVGDNLSGNTALAHQMLALAAERGLAEQAWDRLYRAHFGERRSIFDIDSLVELGTEIGLQAGEVREALESGRFAAQVEADGRAARSAVATGVPFFVFDNKYAVSGAQPAEVLMSVLEQVKAAV